ncbi:uncharacterized protein [Dysidea avara]|uniref:uncharacterized protein isoform X2 n=1 Tax=Dysidea avara TaxID=196820 RepID=UPI00332E3F1B
MARAVILPLLLSAIVHHNTSEGITVHHSTSEGITISVSSTNPQLSAHNNTEHESVVFAKKQPSPSSSGYPVDIPAENERRKEEEPLDIEIFLSNSSEILASSPRRETVPFVTQGKSSDQSLPSISQQLMHERQYLERDPTSADLPLPSSGSNVSKDHSPSTNEEFIGNLKPFVVNQRGSKGMSTLAEQKCCTHFDRHRMNEPQNEYAWNRRIGTHVKEVVQSYYSMDKDKSMATLVSLYYQCNATSTSGYFIEFLTESSCRTLYSVSLQTTFVSYVHDVNNTTIVADQDDQSQENESDSDSEANDNSEDEDEHGDQHNSNNSGATGGSGSGAGSGGGGNDDNNWGGDDNHSNNGGNNIHEDDEDDDDDESMIPLAATEHDASAAVFSCAKTVFTETDLQNIPKLIPIQPCEGIIVAPNYGICGIQSCLVTGITISTQNTDPTTECCSSVPPIREGQPTISGIILNNPQCENSIHSNQLEVLTSREEQGIEQFHVVGPVDEMDGFLQQDDSVPIHEPIQVCDGQSSVGACETFMCDGPFQEEEM